MIETIKVEVDEECNRLATALIFNIISYKLRELGEIVNKNLETYDLLLSHFPLVKLNKEKFERETLELSKKIAGKIAEIYTEHENSADNKLYARTVFWRALMTTFIAITLQESEGLGREITEFIQEQLGGVKVNDG